MPCENVCVPKTEIFKEVKRQEIHSQQNMLASAFILPDTSFNTHANTHKHVQKLC